MDGLLFLLAESGAEGVEGVNWTRTAWLIGLALLLVALNGFFVAAEFALVKVRPSQIEKMIADGLPFAGMAKWLSSRMDHTLSACQLGITMASLGLGYVGEPAFARVVEPAIKKMGVSSENAVHIVAFLIAFSVITSLHLVIGEQAPKIYALRRPRFMTRWCAPLMKFFYYLLFPFMYVLNWATEIVLGMLGIGGGTGHGLPHSEEEIRALLTEAHIHGHLTRSEHTLLNAVFEFDDMVCRLVMVPRGEVVILDVNQPFHEQLRVARETKHTRYPLCDGSLDNLLGVVHMKDLLGVDPTDESFDLRNVMRDPVKVPENMPISKVLREIQTSHQLMTFVVDEYGTIIGIATLENLLEKIIGPVDDEFDHAQEPLIQPVEEGHFIVLGQTPISELERALNLNLDDDDSDTVAGVLMARSGKMPEVGDRIQFIGASAEIMEVQNDHAERIRFQLDAISSSEQDEEN